MNKDLKTLHLSDSIRSIGRDVPFPWSLCPSKRLKRCNAYVVACVCCRLTYIDSGRAVLMLWMMRLTLV